MKLIFCAVIQALTFFSSESKSVDSNINSVNSVYHGIESNKTDPTFSQKEMELEELKDNIGKVGNKLENIVYEVLKDFFQNEFNEKFKPAKNLNYSQAQQEDLLVKYHPTSLQNPNDTSVIEDDVVHTNLTETSNIVKEVPPNHLTPTYNNVEIPINEEFDPILYDYELYPYPDTTTQQTTSESGITNGEVTQPSNEATTDLNKTENPTTTEILSPQTTSSPEILPTTTLKATTIKTLRRKRRMIFENPEQTRSVENFIESNPEQPENPMTRKNFDADKIKEPMVLRVFQPESEPEEQMKVAPPKRQEKRPAVRTSGRKDNADLAPKDSHRRKKPPLDDDEAVETTKRRNIPSDRSEEPQDSHRRRKVLPEEDANTRGIMVTTPGSDDSRLGQSFGWNNPPGPMCFDKNERDDIIEKQHIEDLKYEVTKLRSVVDLLKEQQRLLNSVDTNDKNHLNEQQMLSVLNQLNNKEKPTIIDNKFQPSTSNAVEKIDKAKHEELGMIKLQLKDAIENLNRTKDILNLEHKKEMNLEEEMKNQRTEINWLKLIIENFIIAQTKKKIKENENSVTPKSLDDEIKKGNETENHIVGSPLQALLGLPHHNRTIPSTVKMAEEKLKELEKKRSRENLINDEDDREINRRLANLKIPTSNARASDFSTIGKLLDAISDKQSKTDDDDDLQLKLIEAVSGLRKKKDKELSAKELIKKLQNSGLESKSDDDDMSSLLKLQKALKNLDSPQSKSDDLDLETQLKLLQREIGKLRPNDDLDFLPTESKGPGDDPVQFQAMLNRLIAANPQFQGKLPQMSPQQLIQLQKKFHSGPGYMSPGIGSDYGGPQGGYGYGGALGKYGMYGPFGVGYGPYSPSYGGGGYGYGAAGSHGYNGGGTGYSASYGAGSGYSGGPGYTGGSGYSGGSGYNGGSGYTGSSGYSGGIGYSGANGYSGGSNGYGSAAGYNGGSGYSTGFLNNGYSGPAGLGSYSGSKYGGSLPADYTSSGAGYGGQSAYNGYGSKIDQYFPDKNYAGSPFFQVTQPSSYGAGPPAPYPSPKTIDAPGPDRLYQNQYAFAGISSPYAADKVEDLKTQIYGLQNAINSYNRPEYTQTPEDKSTIYSLEQQIDELKGIVNNLNGYQGDQPGYSSAGGSYDSSNYGSPSAPSPDANYRDSSDKRNRRKINHFEDQHSRKKRSLGNEEQTSSWLHKINSWFSKTLGSAETPRTKRFIHDGNSEELQASGVLDKLTSALSDALDEEPTNRQPMPNMLPTLPRVHSTKAIQSNSLAKEATLEDIRNRIDHLKKQLGHQTSPTAIQDLADSPPSDQASSRHASLPDTSYNYNYNYGLNQFPKDLSVKPKKIEIFKSIVAKVMDKVIESLPVILHKLFGFAVHELTAYGDNGYGGGYGSDYGISVFKNLGIFGYLPIILLRIINALSSFIYILQKNKFLKYFLVPAGVVLIVAGSVVFLIWWMQPSDYYLSYDKPYDKGYDKDYSYGYDNQNDYEKSSGQIVRTYGVEERKPVPSGYNSNTKQKPLPYALNNNVPYPQYFKPNEMINVPEPIPAYNER